MIDMGTAVAPALVDATCNEPAGVADDVVQNEERQKNRARRGRDCDGSNRCRPASSDGSWPVLVTVITT